MSHLAAHAIDIVLLAGDRGPSDPLASQAGVPGKALVPIAGMSMLERVLRALEAWPNSGRIVVVAPKHPGYRAAAAAAGFRFDDADAAPGRLLWVEPASTLSASVRAGLAECAGELRLILTADHALLDPAWLDAMLASAAQGTDGAVFVGVADWQAVVARFPGSRRTRYRFSDRSICGTNLFAMRQSGYGRLLDLWQHIEQQRKRPWRIVAMLGWRNLAAYLTGRLSMGEAFAALSDRIGVQILAVEMNDPLTAVDVDSAADLALVEAVLAERGAQRC